MLDFSLGRCQPQRCLLAGGRDAGLLAVQAPDCAGDLEHFPDRTRSGLYEGNLIGRQDKGFGFQDGLGKARHRNRGKNQTKQQGTHVRCPPTGPTIIADREPKFRGKQIIFWAWKVAPAEDALNALDTASKAPAQGLPLRQQKGRREAGLFVSKLIFVSSAWRPGRPSRSGSSRRP